MSWVYQGVDCWDKELACCRHRVLEATVNFTLQKSRYPKRLGMGRAGEDPDVEAWLEAVNASAIFRGNGFGPEVTEDAGATD